MAEETTHSDCVTAYSPYWRRMFCFNHNTPYRDPANPTQPPAGVFARLREALGGKTS